MTVVFDEFGGTSDLPDLTTIDGLIQELEIQAAVLTSVTTGGSRIENAQADYVARR